MASQRGVTISGAAAPGPHGLLTAPLSGVSCVWYHIKAESWQVHADAHHWRPVVGLHRGSPFRIGEVLVSASPEPAETVVVEEVRVRRPPTEAEAPMLHRLARLGLLPGDELRRSANAFDVLAWRVTERVIRPGQPAQARGRLVTRRGTRMLKPPFWTFIGGGPR
jgi:hypothetical protein